MAQKPVLRGEVGARALRITLTLVLGNAAVVFLVQGNHEVAYRFAHYPEMIRNMPQRRERVRAYGYAHGKRGRAQ